MLTMLCLGPQTFNTAFGSGRDLDKTQQRTSPRNIWSKDSRIASVLLWSHAISLKPCSAALPAGQGFPFSLEIYPKVIWLLPPGGFSTRDEGLPGHNRRENDTVRHRKGLLGLLA